MSEETGETDAFEMEESVGQRLREARRAKGYDLSHVAAETRIPERHLIAIEEGAFERLPARTYAVGFSRSYARLVGLDEKQIANQVRAELSAGMDASAERQAKFEPGDPERVPSRRLAYFSLFAVLLLLAGGFAFYRAYFAPGMGPPPLEEERRVNAEQAAGRPTRIEAENGRIDPAGAVVFTAKENDVWVRFYDGDESNVLFEDIMAQGESFTIPTDADEPQIRTGRPDAFTITIDGQSVPPLAEDDFVMSDVGVSGEALLGRDVSPTSAAPQNETAATDAPAAAPAPAPAAAPADTSAAQPDATDAPAAAARQ